MARIDAKKKKTRLHYIYTCHTYDTYIFIYTSQYIQLTVWGGSVGGGPLTSFWPSRVCLPHPRPLPSSWEHDCCYMVWARPTTRKGRRFKIKWKWNVNMHYIWSQNTIYHVYTCIYILLNKCIYIYIRICLPRPRPLSSSWEYDCCYGYDMATPTTRRGRELKIKHRATYVYNMHYIW